MQFIKLLKPYIWWAILVTALGFATNILALYVPKLSAKAIDQFMMSSSAGTAYQIVSQPIFILMLVVLASLLAAVIQIFASTYLSEKVALDLRHKLISKISQQTYGYISASTPGRILTVMTSDIDAVKAVLSQGLVTLLGAAVTLIGAAILLLTINVRLALYTLSVIPLLMITFVFVFAKLGALFQKSQENLERINALINETIVGSALVRVLNSISAEIEKFKTINSIARDTGIKIVRTFAALIPVITLLANGTTLIIIWFGGRQVINQTLSIGNFSAFFAYSAMFVWPLFVLGFVGSSISRGGVSLRRITDVLEAPVVEETGTLEKEIIGDVEFQHVSLSYKDEGGQERVVLSDVSFKVKSKTRNAIVGPTAAGKTQLFYLMAGLVRPTSGTILIDGRPIDEYKSDSLLSQIGLVFQDSIVFNTTFRENVALSGSTNDTVLEKALKTAELDDMIQGLPKGLDTFVSERGTSLSGGQKQRMMLARALAVSPKILLLDDFTARVDRATESSILKNVRDNYPEVTLISITQKVEPIKDYDSIIVLMEGELVAIGTHDELLKSSFEYRQIYESQMSTESIGQSA